LFAKERFSVSEGYATKAACLNGVESNRVHGKAFFNLKASNGQIIGSSEMYETEASQRNPQTPYPGSSHSTHFHKNM
jgi:uncharacterized protein YegP (UPF0339 family)